MTRFLAASSATTASVVAPPSGNGGSVYHHQQHDTTHPTNQTHSLPNGSNGHYIHSGNGNSIVKKEEIDTSAGDIATGTPAALSASSSVDSLPITAATTITASQTAPPKLKLKLVRPTLKPPTATWQLVAKTKSEWQAFPSLLLPSSGFACSDEKMLHEYINNILALVIGDIEVCLFVFFEGKALLTFTFLVN